MTMVKKPRSESSGSASMMTNPPTSPPTRLILNLQSQPPTVSVALVNDVWDQSLRPSVETILKGDLNSLVGRREQLYREVERLVKLDFSKNLFEKVEYELQVYSESVFRDEAIPVESIVGKFEQFVASLHLLSKIFNSLDRDLVYRSTSTSRSAQGGLPKNLTALGFAVWRNNMCRPEHDQSNAVVDHALRLIYEYRTSGHHLETLGKIINMLMKIEIFHTSFEKRYLDSTREFYSQAADSPSTLRDYVEFVGSAMSFERQFVADLGFPTSTWKIEDNDILRTEMVMNRLPRMIQKGLGGLMDQMDTGTLRSLYSLCQLVADKLVIESVFRFSLQEAVMQICTRAVGSIEQIIHTQHNMKRILSESFDDRLSFHGAYKDAMESVLNGPSNAAIPSMLAAWSDHQLYKLIDSENAEMADGHAWMDQMIGVFKLLNSKDVFEVHYRAFLSKRLLYISSSFGSLGHLINHETATVNLLKQECGAGYTNKLESMIRDVAVSEEISRDEMLYGQQILGRTLLRVTVATTGVWPLTAWAERVKVPHAIHDLEIAFIRRYMDKNPKKSIKFVHAMTSAVVRFKRKEFVCSAAQALILCLLNDSDSVDKTFVVSETSLPEVEAVKALSTLEESGLIMQQDEIYSVNPNFKIPSSGQIVLNQYQYRRIGAEPEITDEERAQTEASVMEDRQHQLDASIVRVMKRLRKAVPSTLYAEILNITKFAFSKQEVTKRVTSLVDREFLERDPGEDGEIRYLA